MSDRLGIVLRRRRVWRHWHTVLMGRSASLLAAIAVTVVTAACGGDDAEDTTPASEPPLNPDATDDVANDGLFPDVVEVSATQDDDGTWTFDVTVSSPYDSPTRYADAWRVVTVDGTELGIRVLLHDHAGEQPFTRSLSGVEIPDGVTEVIVDARDQLNGWGGTAVVYTIG